MKVAVLGTGVVGRAWAARLVELGHVVVVGTRDHVATRERDGHAWDRMVLGDYAKAVVGTDLVINALNGPCAIEALTSVGEALKGRVLMDISNPLDYSAGAPRLMVDDAESLGEKIQRALPSVRVVKALNTLGAAMQVRPMVDGTVFVAGDDAGAKELVTKLLHAVGHADVIDLGDLTGARGVELSMPLWMRLGDALETAEFSIKVVRH